MRPNRQVLRGVARIFGYARQYLGSADGKLAAASALAVSTHWRESVSVNRRRTGQSVPCAGIARPEGMF